ncbi:MAG: hypothetical protein GY862_38940 [Gammaproteobacteria bacterium]|nr:hypothetical protein [Gammaproteobacteria bacterium]
MPSFPQTRESRRRPLDSRVRGNDESDIAAAQADSRFFTASTGVPDIEAEDAETENIWEIAMQPYAAGRIKPASHLPELNDLQHLCELLSGEQVSQGALRELMNLFYLSRPRAKSGLERWKENMEKTGQGEVMKSIFETLGKLLDEAEEDFPVIDKHRKTTPFGDALAWLAVARGNHD